MFSSFLSLSLYVVSTTKKTKKYLFIFFVIYHLIAPTLHIHIHIHASLTQTFKSNHVFNSFPLKNKKKKKKKNYLNKKNELKAQIVKRFIDKKLLEQIYSYRQHDKLLGDFVIYFLFHVIFFQYFIDCPHMYLFSRKSIHRFPLNHGKNTMIIIYILIGLFLTCLNNREAKIVIG